MSKFYNDGVITIPNVTGDLEITVTAVKSAPSYTNQIPISTDADGSIYNSIGYMLNMRLPSNGVPSATEDYLVTGFIPFKTGDTIRLSHFCSGGAIVSNVKIIFYTNAHTLLASRSAGQLINDGAYTKGAALTYAPGTSVVDAGSGAVKDISTAAYFRACIGKYNDVAADIICTINEEIT